MRRAPLLATALTVVISAGACTTTGIGTTTTTASDQAPMAIAVSTQSATARDEFLRGLRAQDVERNTEARQHFDRAVAADPNFALAHLYAALRHRRFHSIGVISTKLFDLPTAHRRRSNYGFVPSRRRSITTPKVRL